ncbi:MAG: hypothetical protein CMH30_07155 [Micavibrio sp.]|nr:hypothetical protein [Micavibrio sp.]|tara:strand:+ start:172 stop:777 length:606 start_codon:yes stop_codon:yes gene_type:complete
MFWLRYIAVFALVIFGTGCTLSENKLGNDFDQALNGNGCHGVVVPEGSETIDFYSRWDRRESKFLKAHGEKRITQSACQRRGDQIYFNAIVEMNFEIGRLGREMASDPALYLFPYGIFVVSDNNDIVAQEFATASVNFAPNQSKKKVTLSLSKQLTLDESLSEEHQGYTVYMGFIQPEGRVYENEGNNPPLDYVLIRKPAA